jgi:hypothetical protein
MRFDAVVIGGGGQLGLSLEQRFKHYYRTYSYLGHPETNFQLTLEEAFANEKHD